MSKAKCSIGPVPPWPWFLRSSFAGLEVRRGVGKDEDGGGGDLAGREEAECWRIG